MRHLLWMVLLVACGPKPDPETTTESGDSSAGTTTEPLSYCDGLGLPERPFDAEAQPMVGRYNVAADFQLPTTNGLLRYSELWTGCDNVAFVPDADQSSSTNPQPLWSRDLRKLLNSSPENVHYVFFSTSGDAKEKVEALEADYNDILANWDEEKQAQWAGRLHYVKRPFYETDGWPADHFSLTGYGFVVDRHQKIRDIGSLASGERYNPEISWFDQDLSHVANEVVYANFVTEREERLAAEADQVTILTGLDEVRFGGNQYFDVTFPDEAGMANFDTLEIDLEQLCDGDREFGSCPAWDYLVYMYQCARPVEETNPYAEESCQPYVPGVATVVEVLGTCYVDGQPSSTTCREATECDDAVPLPSTDATDSGLTASTSTTDSGLPSSTSAADSGLPGGATSTSYTTSTSTSSSTVRTCEGYVAPVEGVTEIPADTYTCECDEPDRTVSEATYTCNAEGTGYNDCSCGCGTEVGRWITTYHREGRWVHDISPMLSYLEQGGTQTFRFYSSQTYTTSIDFRLSNRGKQAAPQELVPLFNGGSFDEFYNDKYEPLEIDIPADVTRVDLVAVISGHGFGQDVANCAEFCNHTHHFTVNGTEFTKEHPWADVSDGCVQQVAEGTVPNQFGTWFYGRGGWCPGYEVKPFVVDVTDSLTPGSTATITYEGKLGGEPYVPEPANNGGFGANINMNSYLAFTRE